MKIQHSEQTFKKYNYIKFNENPSSGSRVVPTGRTDRQIGITKLIVVFRNFAHESTKDVLKKNNPLRNTKVSKHEIIIFCHENLSDVHQHCRQN